MSSTGERTARPKASAGDVEAFLKRFIDAMDRAGGLTLWNTAKNRAFEDETGFTKRDAEDLVRSLGHRQYSRGPEADDNPDRQDGEVWMFHAELSGYWIYLKLKLTGTAGNHSEAACLSFHEAEREMATPLKMDSRGDNLQTRRRRGRQGL